MKKYTLKQFEAKYFGERGICCGINYSDKTHDTVMGASFSQIMSIINTNKKEVVFIASK